MNSLDVAFTLAGLPTPQSRIFLGSTKGGGLEFVGTRVVSEPIDDCLPI
jgi:hypothetical protein